MTTDTRNFQKGEAVLMDNDRLLLTYGADGGVGVCTYLAKAKPSKQDLNDCVDIIMSRCCGSSKPCFMLFVRHAPGVSFVLADVTLVLPLVNILVEKKATLTQNLRGTVICPTEFKKIAKEALHLFLSLYKPTLPFHVIADEQKASAKVEQLARECASGEQNT